MIQQSTKQVQLNFQKFIQKIFPSVLGYVINGELLIIVPKNKIKKILLFLKNNTNTQFKALSDISGADYPDKKNRFEVIYNLLSIYFVVYYFHVYGVVLLLLLNAVLMFVQIKYYTIRELKYA
mgnify:CR=1 FL=1